ncbi:MAG: adenosine kinase [Deltaproteobacteria bacterium]|nr:adenosine kinase [Deltaproteobacteria bacterium]
MTAPTYDVTALGNAIVDVLASCDDAFLDSEGLTKGGMALIDADQAESLYSKMTDRKGASGGSAANTIAGLASLGAKVGYIGKVAKDELGDSFRKDICDLGVHFETPADDAGKPTARCLILVTDDAQRTMNTFLGACTDLTEADVDVDVDLVKNSKVIYLEGYLWDPDHAKAAFRKAMAVAHEAGRQVAFTLSDGFCVERHRDEFKALVESDIDILFANEAEIVSLYQVETFDEALQAVRGKCKVAALTRSEKGAVIVAGDEVHVVDAAPVDKVVDTTGAGDLYAAGFLHGYTQGKDLATCGKMGGIAAAEVISHFGARPEANLAELLKKNL